MISKVNSIVNYLRCSIESMAGKSEKSNQPPTCHQTFMNFFFLSPPRASNRMENANREFIKLSLEDDLKCKYRICIWLNCKARGGRERRKSFWLAFEVNSWMKNRQRMLTLHSRALLILQLPSDYQWNQRERWMNEFLIARWKEILLMNIWNWRNPLVTDQLPIR